MTGEWPTGSAGTSPAASIGAQPGGPDATWRAAFGAGVVLDELITGIPRTAIRGWGRGGSAAVGDVLEHEDQ